jgi:hypothetical protein
VPFKGASDDQRDSQPHAGDDEHDTGPEDVSGLTDAAGLGGLPAAGASESGVGAATGG